MNKHLFNIAAVVMNFDCFHLHDTDVSFHTGMRILPWYIVTRVNSCHCLSHTNIRFGPLFYSIHVNKYRAARWD